MPISFENREDSEAITKLSRRSAEGFFTFTGSLRV